MNASVSKETFMPKVANPILKIQKAVEALKTKNAKLNADIAVRDGGGVRLHLSTGLQF